MLRLKTMLPGLISHPTAGDPTSSAIFSPLSSLSASIVAPCASRGSNSRAVGVKFTHRWGRCSTNFAVSLSLSAFVTLYVRSFVCVYVARVCSDDVMRWLNAFLGALYKAGKRHVVIAIGDLHSLTTETKSICLYVPLSRTLRVFSVAMCISVSA